MYINYIQEREKEREERERARKRERARDREREWNVDDVSTVSILQYYSIIQIKIVNYERNLGSIIVKILYNQ